MADLDKTQALAEAAGADYDIFFRTTESRHKSSVEHVWVGRIRLMSRTNLTTHQRTLMEKDYIYKAQYEGWYCVSDETYYTPNQIRDETASDGTNIKVSIESGQLVEWMQEENYMFKLSAFQERLIEWLHTHPEGNVDSLHRFIPR
jgi:methionyl-tRNA synthetase